MNKLATVVIVGTPLLIYEQLVPLFPRCKFDVMSYNQLYTQLCERDIQILFLEWTAEEEGLYRLKLLKRLCPKLKIIMMNSCAYPIRRAMFSGAFAVLDYPLDIDEIQELLWSLSDINVGEIVKKSS